MFEEEENNTDFAAETILGAILRKERAMFRLFGIKEQKKSTTMNGSSVSTKGKNTFRDNIKEQEKNTTYSWPPTSSTYKKKSQSRTNKSEEGFSNWTGIRNLRG